jgi:hypothetical protein
MSAVEARNYQLAQQAVQAAQGCGWAPHAQAQLRDLICMQAEISVLEALNAGGVAAAQNAIRTANAQGCGISPQTNSLVASVSQTPPSFNTAPPSRSGPSASEWMEMLSGVTQSLIAMQGGDPGTMPTYGQPATAGPTRSPPGGQATPGGQANPGETPQQCAQRLCERECADAIGLLTEGTTATCDRCLKSRIGECSGGSESFSGSSPGGGDRASSGSGAWADPQWTMPTGEGGGHCYAGKSWTRPRRYAIACDGNDGSALYKLAVGGHPSVVYGPASFTDCQRYLAMLTGGQ